MGDEKEVAGAKEADLPAADGILGLVKGKLLALTAVLVVIPSLINASLDVYYKIVDIPVGEKERAHKELSAMHFQDAPLLTQPVSVKLADVTVDMKLMVFPNGDIFVKSGSNEQWLPFRPVKTASASFLIASAWADESRPANASYAGEQRALVIDVDKLGVSRAQQQAKGAAQIQMDYLLAETKDDHKEFFTPSTQVFVKNFPAEKGYVIKTFSWDAISVHHGGIEKIELVEQGKTLRVSYRLSSGPTLSQWSGWIKGTIKTTQERL